MYSFHVGFQVPLAIALVAAVRTALRFRLTAGGLHVLHKVMLPSIGFGAFGTFVPSHDLNRMLDCDLAIGVVIRSAGIPEYLIGLPDST